MTLVDSPEDVVWVTTPSSKNQTVYHLNEACYQAPKVPTLRRYAERVGLTQCVICYRRNSHAVDSNHG